MAYEPLVLPEPPEPDFYDPAWDEWDTKRPVSRVTVIVIVVAIILGIGGFVVYQAQGGSSKGGYAAIPPPTTFSIAKTASMPPPKVFKGKESTTTPQFTMGGGLAVLSATCKCPAGKFEVQVVDSTGNNVATAINTSGWFGSGNFAGSVPLNLPAGSYTLGVSAIGPWRVSIAAPPPTQPTLPIEKRVFGGSGPSVIGPFASGHAYTVIWWLQTTASPVQLQKIDAVSGAATTLKTSTGTPKALLINLPAQSTPFYIAQGDTSLMWGLITGPAK